jgi:thioesterase domain-containing protein
MRTVSTASPTTDAASGARARVVAIQQGRTKPPFFFMHGQWDGGGVFCFPLARDLGADQPFYAVEPYAFRGLRVLPTLETVAAAHVETLRAVQAHGPYYLGGFCNGALVAYEVARQLVAQGEAVGLLALVDPMAPSSAAVLGSVTRSVGEILRWGRDYVYAGALASIAILRVGHLLGMSDASQLHTYLRLARMGRRVAGTYRRLQRVRGGTGFRPPWMAQHTKRTQMVAMAQAAKERGPGTANRSRLPTSAAPVSTLLDDYEAAFIRVASQYTPSAVPCKVTFLWSSGTRVDRYFRTAWRALAARLDSAEYLVAGSHSNLLNESLQALSARLRQCLDEAQRVASHSAAEPPPSRRTHPDRRST